MRKFQDIPNDRLKEMWRERRDAIMKRGITNCSQEEISLLYDIRKELERRIGIELPYKNIDYSQYLTD